MSTSSALKITQTSAGTSAWFKIPSQSSGSDIITFTGTLSSPDSVIVEVSNDPELKPTSTDLMQSTGTTNQLAQSLSQTATSFSGAVLGTWS